ncbi:TPA: TaqI-like C-terminal specificity domain-containing protein [Vibrio cholerae]
MIEFNQTSFHIKARILTSIIAIENAATFALSWGTSDAEKGEVFTKPEIVQFMLTTSGLSRAILNPETRILEPSCGQGEFVNAIAKELCQALKDSEFPTSMIANRFKQLITAYEISNASLMKAKASTFDILTSVFEEPDAMMLVNKWYRNEDFLLSQDREIFTHVIGNPPYVRIENIPSELLTVYRSQFSTMKERADLYVAFYEKSLSLLNEGGILSFICTDRWTKNSYGSSLRDYISRSFQLDLYVDLYGQNAFQSEVLTYPAVTQISKRKQSKTIIIHNPVINDSFSCAVANSLENEKIDFEGKILRKDVVNGTKPWMFGSADELGLINRLEREFPLIEETGCQIFIGAATGNNKVYIIDNSVDIEPCRKIPMVKASDIKKGKIDVNNQYIINTYDEFGLINLEDFPKLKIYLEGHSEELKKRHIAKVSPSAWFKTIDRVYPERAKSEKLLIPDIKSELFIVHDDGGYHPNNSIYYICSKNWDLKALQGVLISGLGQLFVEIYSTKVSGGNLRFQAQHLRRIRVPYWDNVSESIRVGLKKAAVEGNTSLAKELVCSLYNFSEKEKQVIGC